jgi:hypothetical protein
MGYQAIEAIERKRRNIRIVLFIIILGTLPMYCAGFVLWGTAPRQSVNADGALVATQTPIGSDITFTPGLPTVTPLNLNPTLLSPLQPTPLQFIPINRPPLPTQPLIPNIPTSTLAPTLTLIPSNPPELPTQTPLPTDVPTETPFPTNTDVPPEIPTNTPLPFEDLTADPGAGGN